MTDNSIEKYGWNPDMPRSLLEKLKADLKQSMRRKDTHPKDAIRQIMAEFPKLTVPITLKTGKKTTRPKKNEEITNNHNPSIAFGFIVLPSRFFMC